MKKIFEYNINLPDITPGRLKNIYTEERNACFAGVYYDMSTDTYYAVTDHLGNVPIFYSITGESPRFTLEVFDIIPRTLSEKTVQRFLATGSLRFLDEISCRVVPPGTIVMIQKENGFWKESTYTKYQWDTTKKLSFSKKKIHTTLDMLLEQATRRAVSAIDPQSRVSLALSGGIDSALTAHYLKKIGMKVDAFTVSPWGEEGIEAVRSRQTAKKCNVDSHTIFDLQTDEYLKYVQEYKNTYPYPNGSVASLTISTLFNHTDITKNNMIFFAQNADTSFCSVIHQFSTFLYMKIPYILRKYLRLPYFIPDKTVLENYKQFVLLGNSDWWEGDIIDESCCHTTIQKLSFAGMLWGHTPSDGEVFVAPGVKHAVSVKNIFYDVDLIEYIIHIPLRYRISWSHESKIGIALSKKMLLQVALRLGIGKKYQKKGLVLPKNRDGVSETFFNNMPHAFMGKKIKSENHQFALHMLKEYAIAISKTDA